MTLSITDYRDTTNGNGSTDTFNIPFRFDTDAEIQVTLVTAVTGAKSVLALTTHYTLTGAGLDSGGSCIMITPPASGEITVTFFSFFFLI